jgi:virginiamycin B lyase
MKVRARQAARLVPVTALAITVAACGGGGGSAPAPVVVPGAATPTAAPVAGSVGAGALSFTILIPNKTSTSAGRTPAFTSPSTASVAIALAGSSTPLATANLSAASPGCAPATGGTSCTVTTAAPAGNDTFVITTYDAANATGHLLSTANVPAAISANSTTRIPLTLNGVVNSVSVLLGTSSVPAGAPAKIAVTVVAYDAQNNVIVGSGNFSPAVVLTDSDTSGVTSLSANGTTASSVSVTAPGTSVTLNYNGNSLASAAITPSLSGAAGTLTAATFAPTGTVFSIIPPQGTDDITALALGSDNNIWFASSGNATNTFGKMTPSGVVTLYPNPISTNYPYGVALASDGALWFSDESGVFARVDTSGNVTPATSYTTPCLSTTSTCEAVYSMARASDGNIWFTDPDYGYIGLVTPAGAVTEFDITQIPGWPNGYSPFPEQITSTPLDPGAVYVADDDYPMVYRIAISNGVPTAMTVVNTPGCDTEAIAVTSDGNVWWGDDCANVGMAPITNFTDGAVLEWSIAGAFSSQYIYTLLATPGGLWATNDDDSYVYRISSLNGLSATQGPIVTPLAIFQSSANALAVGSDANVWAANDSSSCCGGPSVIAKIIYGGSTSPLSVLNAKRATAAVRHGANVHLFGKRKHQSKHPSGTTRRPR